MEVEEKKGYCTLCRSRCGTINTVKNDVLVKVRPDPDHPTGSAMCMKGKAAPELVHSPNRKLYPMRRTTPKGSSDPGWMRITWEQALTEIAGKLLQFKRESGPESMVFGVSTPSGTPMSDSIDWVERFIWSYGSPNICYATEICNWHKDFAHAFTFGCGLPTADYQYADVIVLWGTNPTNTWLAQADAIGRGRRAGASLVVVDPRPTELAKEANAWMRVRPGTDGALALGIARRMIEIGNVDYEFVKKWTNGPLLVRSDNGMFLRERDISPGSSSNRYMAWNALKGWSMPVASELQQSPGDLAITGAYEIRTIDPKGRTIFVQCVPAFQIYRDALESYTPDAVEQITGVERAVLLTVAGMLKPGKRIAYHSWSGVAQHTNATQTERAIATLYALTGAFDTRGSNRVLTQQPYNRINAFSLLDPLQAAKALGLGDRPIGPAAHGWVTARDVYKAIICREPYQVRGLFAFGTNMLASHADADSAHEALSSLEFHVHCDLFETPTSRYADIFLPVNTPWEREALRFGFEINDRAVELIQLRQRMVSPRGESRGDYEIVFDLAKRIGLEKEFYEGNVEAGWNHMLAPLGLDIGTLRGVPEGVIRPLVQNERKYAFPTENGLRGFDTETQRIELYSEKLLRHGYPAVPAYVPPNKNPTPENNANYPLIVTSIKNGYYCHSQHRSLASLRRRAPYPVVEISVELAEERKIVDGDWVKINSTNGSARFRARVIKALARDVIVAEYGWWQSCDEIGMEAMAVRGPGNSNFNKLADGTAGDPISGSSPLRSILCNIDLDPSYDVMRRAWQGFRDFYVASIKAEASGVRTVTLAAVDGGSLPDYLPGQHITVSVPSLGEEGTTRAYSLVGPAVEPDRKTYSISVRHQRGTARNGQAFEGAMSSYIHNVLKVGDRVSVRSPSGIFTLPLTCRQPIVLVAGGIGITPFISYLESVKDSPDAPETLLLYANLNSRTHAYRERVAELKGHLSQFKVIDCYNQPEGETAGVDYDLMGYLTAKDVDEDLIQRRARFYLCGPDRMMEAFITGLTDRGVPSFDIFKEAFKSPSKPNLDASQHFTVQFTRSNVCAEWSSEKGSLLSFAESLGISMPSGCRVGQCESCAVRVVSGKVDHMGGHGPEEDGMCFACQAIPASKIEIEV
ncbi:molybdopterin-dependent oxidoreductase [Paraburkholderia sp. Ac-20336]|uniref:molybdopterin-dependent oxidoreductase n=1 Tax=Paraburkholderia sp. Ac-20336 TaxID=2703886 RepID=UPI0019805A07|nr:molybdopterin-dependent oxidoreductase [Paraburkholderia sp. Ac-20336]MBN3802015.1 molybdopterin-dependent oxidoreductase [Paraburkholderia sp. Ac-20336]